MAEYRLGRSEYRFDPTATEAVARVDRRSSTPSTEDIEKSASFIFEPTKPISKGQIRRVRYQRRIDELFSEELSLDEVARVLEQDRKRVEEVVKCMVDGGTIVSKARRRQLRNTWAGMAR